MTFLGILEPSYFFICPYKWKLYYQQLQDSCVPVCYVRHKPWISIFAESKLIWDSFLCLQATTSLKNIVDFPCISQFINCKTGVTKCCRLSMQIAYVCVGRWSTLISLYFCANTQDWWIYRPLPWALQIKPSNILNVGKRKGDHLSHLGLYLFI